MRLWSIHPCYLDAKGLVALWRESLLAQNVLRGNTRGYTNHPQLKRFRSTKAPLDAIANYLKHVADEADKRGYNFSREKIIPHEKCNKIPVTTGQLDYEFEHLLNKLKIRDTNLYENLKPTEKIKTHPLFKTISGDIADWEVRKL